MSHYLGNINPRQQKWHHQAPSLGITLCISASSTIELCLWVPVLYLFCAFITNTCPKVIVFSFYTIWVYQRFHRNALLLDSGGKPVLENSWNKASWKLPGSPSTFIWVLTSTCMWRNYQRPGREPLEGIRGMSPWCFHMVRNGTYSYQPHWKTSWLMRHSLDRVHKRVLPQ